jgi:L-seryl-tRNA(Ser) seleniumtransferase
MPESPLRQLPAVHVLVENLGMATAVAEYGREAVVQAARAVLESARERARESGEAPGLATLLEEVSRRLGTRPTLYQTVLNATGVVLHTNLGRAPMPKPVWQAMRQALGYCDLELDLGTGKRASRLRGVEEPLVAVTGARAGMVVNNNAAAVLLGLAALAGEQPTAISRGHMVEIGGGFRLPTIMEASGSPLIEIGTTNRTHLKDYREALDAGAALLLFVHRSNFVMSGYVTEPEPEQVIALAHERGVPVMLDLGSGALRETAGHGLPEELTVQRAVRMGFDLVAFSGDKLLGGPQAGYLVGDPAAVESARSHPLARALRCDKLQLVGCVATLELYRRGEAESQIPIWSMLSAPRDLLRVRAESWHAAIGTGEVIDCIDAVGGGSLPEGRLEGSALSLASDDPDSLLLALRRATPPVIGHIVEDQVLLHPRTVRPEDDEALASAVRAALAL